VLHVALRAPRDAVINSDGVNVVPEVWSVKDKIKEFSDTFRSGSWVNFQSIFELIKRGITSRLTSGTAWTGWSNWKTIDECCVSWNRW
jgi:hypothetical protein